MFSHDIKIRANGIDLPQSIVNYIYDKIGSIKKFLRGLEPKGVVDIDVEISRTTKHHRNGPIYRAECNIVLPGRLLRAEHEDWDMRRSIDEIKFELQREVKKYIKRLRPQDSRGQEILRKLRGK